MQRDRLEDAFQTSALGWDRAVSLKTIMKMKQSINGTIKSWQSLDNTEAADSSSKDGGG